MFEVTAVLRCVTEAWKGFLEMDVWYDYFIDCPVTSR